MINSKLSFPSVCVDQGVGQTTSCHWRGKEGEFYFFKKPLFLKFYWISYNAVSILCFVFLGTRHMGSNLPNQGHFSCIRRQSLNHWTTTEVPGEFDTDWGDQRELQKDELLKKFFFRVFSHICYYKIMNIVPCAIQ